MSDSLKMKQLSDHNCVCSLLSYRNLHLHKVPCPLFSPWHSGMWLEIKQAAECPKLGDRCTPSGTACCKCSWAVLVGPRPRVPSKFTAPSWPPSPAPSGPAALTRVIPRRGLLRELWRLPVPGGSLCHLSPFIGSVKS